MAVRLQIKINAPSRETRRSAETNSKHQGGPGSYQEEGAPDVLPHHDSSPPHSLDGGIALATVEARLDAKDNEWGPGVASDSSEQKRPSIDVEPSENQYSLKRKRSNASGENNIERRLRPLELRGAAHHGSPDPIDPTDAWKQIVITKPSQTSATPPHVFPAASTSTNRTVMVGKVEDEGREQVGVVRGKIALALAPSWPSAHFVQLWALRCKFIKAGVICPPVFEIINSGHLPHFPDRPPINVFPRRARQTHRARHFPTPRLLHSYYLNVTTTQSTASRSTT